MWISLITNLKQSWLCNYKISYSLTTPNTFTEYVIKMAKSLKSRKKPKRRAFFSQNLIHIEPRRNGKCLLHICNRNKMNELTLEWMDEWMNEWMNLLIFEVWNPSMTSFCQIFWAHLQVNVKIIYVKIMSSLSVFNIFMIRDVFSHVHRFSNFTFQNFLARRR